jgi:hypothetical protein
MPRWLVDEPSFLWTVLGIIALAFAVAWWRTPRRAYAFGAAAALGLLLLVVALFNFIDTDSKRIERSIQAMASAVDAHRLDDVFSHISAEFRFEAMDKEQFRQWAKSIMDRYGVSGMQTWDYQPVAIDLGQRLATVTFKVKAHGIETQGVTFYNCRAKFVLDPDDQWRLKGFEIFPPHIAPGSGQSLPLPH